VSGNRAIEIPRAIVILAAHNIEGQTVLETECANYDCWLSLPSVVSYDGATCAKTGWSSDTNRACYKSVQS
jgi:hypothetical protein